METKTVPTLKSSWPKPTKPLPIVIIGAGGIMNDAHLPAYRKAGWTVGGIYDVDAGRAKATAEKFGIGRVFGSLEEVCKMRDVVFDVAVPPEYSYATVQALPVGSPVLLQKPMGVDLKDAQRIRNACHERKQTAAVNFQLRFSPMMLALRDALTQGLLGQIVDVEVRLNLRTPWELFPFLEKLDRVEIQVHSVHYLDWIRSILGEPKGVYARTVQHPAFPKLKSTKTSAILDYGNNLRCCLSINHNFEFGPQHEAASVSVQGTNGAAVITLGLLLNYPTGKPETVEITTRDLPWTQVPIDGRWFPDGFVGRMANLQRFIAGEDSELVSSVDDALKTMAVVEACYASNAHGGIAPATQEGGQ
jgi:predicted dehydrogenase